MVNNNYKILKLYIEFISRGVFQASLFIYFILLIVETIKTGLASYLLDINLILMVIVFSGIIYVIFQTTSANDERSKNLSQKVWNHFFSVISSNPYTKSKWDYIFKEIRAKELIDKNFQFTYRDWYYFLKDKATAEIDLNNWAKRNLPTFYKYGQLDRYNRDWTSFKNVIKTNNITRNQFQLILLLSISSGAFVILQTIQLGYLSIAIGVMVSIFLLFFSHLVFSYPE